MKRQRRDLPPPSSRRAYTPRSYEFAVASNLIRHFRLTEHQASQLVDKWRRLIRSRLELGKTPASTAEHVHRFEDQGVSVPYPVTRERDRTKRRRK